MAKQTVFFNDENENALDTIAGMREDSDKFGIDCNTNLNISGILTATQIADSDSQTGASGQILSSTGTGLDWITVTSDGVDIGAVVTAPASGAIGANKAVVLNTDGSVSELDTTNWTTGKFLGFSYTSYNNSENAKIAISTNIITTSGLTPAERYWVKGNGSLSSTSGSTDGKSWIEVGVALSSTKLLLNIKY